jgi:hypothetical protein
LSETNQTEIVDLGPGLIKVRSRRWIMWGIIMAYVPGLLIVLEIQATSRVMSWLFGFWVLLLCIVVGMATVVTCPRCNKPFHTNGPTFLPVRCCVHCGLHLKADKISAKENAAGNVSEG